MKTWKKWTSALLAAGVIMGAAQRGWISPFKRHPYLPSNCTSRGNLEIRW